MKKTKEEWEIAREKWLEQLQASATQDQRQLVRELRDSGLFNTFEIIQQTFGWRCPAAQKVWSVSNKTGEKLGTHEAVEYLLRVVLGVPTDGSASERSFHRDTKKHIQDLVVLGHEKGHVTSDSDNIRDAARMAVNGTFKKLGLKN